MENSARRLTDKFICLMLLALPLWPGLEGYSDITGAKFRLFAALTLVWLAALGVCAVKYRWRPARPGVFAAWAGFSRKHKYRFLQLYTLKRK